MRRWFIIFVLIGGFLAAPPTEAADYVQRDLRCPWEIDIQVELVPRIGSDPTFVISGGPSTFAQGKYPRIERDGQKLTCTYSLQGPLAGRQAVYAYTAKRTIVECQRRGQNEIRCLLIP